MKFLVDANAIRAELEVQRAKDKEREKKHNQKLRGMHGP
jgi:hypothetical protein